VLVFRALRQRRAGKATVIITNRISQIEPQDSAMGLSSSKDTGPASRPLPMEHMKISFVHNPAKHVPEAEKVLERRPSFTLSGQSSRTISLHH
jgi:hypothetical protein